MRMILAVLLAVALVSGCTTVKFGRDFEIAGFDSSVELGATTQAQVRAMLGPPVSTGIAIEGGERLQEWVYYYGDGKLTNMSDARFKLLQVRFGAEGRVKSYNWSE